MVKSQSQAFTMGFEAFFANVTKNPFVFGTRDATDWLSGFVTAQSMRRAGAC